MIAGNDNKLSYLLKEYLGHEVNVARNGQGQVSAADILKTHVLELLKRDGNLSKAKKFDTSKTLRLSIDIAILLSEIGFSDLAVLPNKKNCALAAVQGNTQGSAKENSKYKKGDLNQAGDKFVYVDNLTLIRASKQVMLKQKCLDITPKEFSLLLLLIDKEGANVSKAVLSQQGIDKKFNSNDRTVDVHISNLRKKLGLDSKGRERIKTVRGFGYQYVIYPDK